MAEYMDEVVVRCAPRWAWEFIDDVLDQLSEYGTALRGRTVAATTLKAMCIASASADMESLSPEETQAAEED